MTFEILLLQLGILAWPNYEDINMKAIKRVEFKTEQNNLIIILKKKVLTNIQARRN